MKPLLEHLLTCGYLTANGKRHRIAEPQRSPSSNPTAAGWAATHQVSPTRFCYPQREPPGRRSAHAHADICARKFAHAAASSSGQLPACRAAALPSAARWQHATRNGAARPTGGAEAHVGAPPSASHLRILWFLHADLQICW